MRKISDPSLLLLGSCQSTLSSRKMAPDKQCRYQRVIGVGDVSQRRLPGGNHFESQGRHYRGPVFWVPGSVKGCGEVKGAVPLQGVCAGSLGRQAAHGRLDG